ncbi:MAG TPA: D-amino acid dehydrogenase [Burkholderiales bacterium]|nr:D-amino acid dehydrogenase [Burkholderiales bacterium]
MKVVVLGAGVVGVTSAWYLAQDGHDVTVIDRQPTAGLETSFANGGQISVSHAEPWANPEAPHKVWKWLGREDAPLMFRLRADPHQWAWGARFLLECLPSRTRENTLTILRLGLYSRDRLKALRRETGIRYDHLEKGILQLHTDAREFEAAHERVALLRSHGLEMQVKSVAECLELEPALRATRIGLIGGTYAPDDESGDAHQFTGNLAELCRDRGVQFGYEHNIEGLQVEGGAVTGAIVRDPEGRREVVLADAFVVALGSYSRFLLTPVGVHVPVYPVKGYSVTIPLHETAAAAPALCLSDENGKIAISRLGDRLRAAGTAELADYDTSLNDARCDAILARVAQWFPGVGDLAGASRWAGLRPATPSNVPEIGRARHRNLFLNTGHGTLGWTLACGSGRALADIVSGRRPEVEFPFR